MWDTVKGAHKGGMSVPPSKKKLRIQNWEDKTPLVKDCFPHTIANVTFVCENGRRSHRQALFMDGEETANSDSGFLCFFLFLFKPENNYYTLDRVV